jgi:hypothetical protein
MNHEYDGVRDRAQSHLREFDETESSHSPYPAKCAEEIGTYESSDPGTAGASGEASLYFHAFPYDYNIFRGVNLDASQIPNEQLRKMTSQFLSDFQRVIMLNRTRIEGSGRLPPLKIRWLEDDSVLTEWIFKDFRIGFSIEPKEKESSWYLVANRNLDEVSTSGTLDLSGPESLLSNLLSFVLANT